MTRMDHWDEEIRELAFQLDELRRARDAATPGGELHQRHQAEAERVGYRWTARRDARPVLSRLYDELATLHRAEDADARDARDGAAGWTRIAVWTGFLGGLTLLATLGLPFSFPWWVVAAAVLSLLVCAAAAVLAVREGTREPGDRSSDLRGRIQQLVKACADCESAEGLVRVERLLRPEQRDRSHLRVL